ncbi:MAG: glycosyltransferase family protein [Ignavibacteriae bacterium]|nr:glycosyltransferase family protein [Ignavibacteriota bacterium]
MNENFKISVVIQARRGSTRLPGKILLDLSGKPLLIRMAERVSAAKIPKKFCFNVIVATTTDKSDDEVYDLCISEKIKCFRGDSHDLLDRHYKAVIDFKPDAVVKIPSDCPLIDPQVIEKVIGYYIENKDSYDFVSNLHPATYPDGNDVEVMSFAALEKTWKTAMRPFEREHTTPYIWENPSQFRIGNVSWETGLDYSMSHRFTIDFMEDYIFIKRIYDELYEINPLFSLYDILKLLEENPEIMNINSKFAGVNWYRKHLNELKTVNKNQTKKILRYE